MKGVEGTIPCGLPDPTGRTRAEGQFKPSAMNPQAVAAGKRKTVFTGWRRLHRNNFQSFNFREWLGLFMAVILTSLEVSLASFLTCIFLTSLNGKHGLASSTEVTAISLLCLDKIAC